MAPSYQHSSLSYTMWDLDYDDLYKFSLKHLEKFWDEVAKDVIWSKSYASVLEDKDSYCPRWFVGGQINMSYNCLDRQVDEGYGDDVAVIHDSPITGSIQKITYKELFHSVELLSGVLVDRCSVMMGDKVLLYFPMIPQCLIAMLACTRIGAISTVVFGGFAVKELASRISFFEPKLIMTANVGLEPGQVVNFKDKVDAAIAMNKFTPDFCIVYNRPNYPAASMKDGRDFEWSSEILNARPQKAIPVESDHPQFVTFTSGTTGEPKGIVRPTAGAVVSNKYSMTRLLGLKPGETFWAMSDFGWAIGQSLSTYGPLMSRNPTIIYEGKPVGTPDAAQVARVINQHNVTIMISVPTIMRLLRRSCSPSDLRLTSSSLREIYLGGEIIDSTVWEWTSKTFNCDVHNVWGQTEVGISVFSSRMPLKGFGKSENSFDTCILMPALSAKVVDRNTGEEVPRGTIGRLILKMPNTPSLITTLYNGHERFIKTYLSKYPGYYDTMDAAIMTEAGHFKIVSRDDDIMHVGAVRICGSAVEEACMKNEEIAEAVVIALEDDLKGHVPFGFLVIKSNLQKSEEEVIAETIKMVLNIIGEVASFNKAVIVPSLPKSITGKTLRNSLADMVNGKIYKVPATVENPKVYAVIHNILQQVGFKPSLPTPN